MDQSMILKFIRELYASSNGDKWEISEDDEKKLFIRHVPSPESEDLEAITTIGTFLQPDYHGAEQDALMKLIDTGEVASPNPVLCPLAASPIRECLHDRFVLLRSVDTAHGAHNDFE